MKMSDARGFATATIATIIALSGCAPVAVADLEAQMRKATAVALDGVTEDQIVVSDAEKSPSAATWKADVGGKIYDCDADDLLRLPQCREQLNAVAVE